MKALSNLWYLAWAIAIYPYEALYSMLEDWDPHYYRTGSDLFLGYLVPVLFGVLVALDAFAAYLLICGNILGALLWAGIRVVYEILVFLLFLCIMIYSYAKSNQGLEPYY